MRRSRLILANARTVTDPGTPLLLPEWTGLAQFVEADRARATGTLEPERLGAERHVHIHLRQIELQIETSRRLADNPHHARQVVLEHRVLGAPLSAARGRDNTPGCRRGVPVKVHA